MSGRPAGAADGGARSLRSAARGLARRARSYVADLRTLPADAATAWRHEGWRGAWTQLRRRSLDRVFRRDRLLVIEQPLGAAPAPRPPAGVGIQRFGGDWEAVRALIGARRAARFRQRLARGRVLLVARRGGRIVGYTWFSERVEPDVEFLPLDLPENAAYLWDLYVVPAERGRGIGSALVAARLRLARERGYELGWRAVAPSNRPSLRTVEKTADGAARVLGELRYVKLPWETRFRFQPTPGGEVDALGRPEGPGRRTRHG